MWFTDYGNAKIGRIIKAGTITEFALNPGASPGSMAPGWGLLDDLRRIVLTKEGLAAALWNEGRRHCPAPT